MFDKYTVKQGDNLNTIANKYNTSVEELKRINNIYFTDNIKENTELIVPTSKEDYYDYYTVEKGDSLYKIGQEYNFNPDLLAALNGLNKGDYIYPNQELLIPKYNYSYYITKEGDTIDTVASLFMTSKSNFINGNPVLYLMPGQLVVNKKD